MHLRDLIPLACVLAAACGSDDPPDRPGDQSFHPPVEQEGEPGTQPPGATSVACDAAADCDYWFCRCADGAVVNSALCVNGFCMDAESACPRACAYFDHGEWTGDAGGGPGSAPACGGLGSNGAACDSCFRTSCCDEGAACGDSGSCLDAWDCAVACGGDPDCRADCEARFPVGASLYNTLEACLVGSCATACGGGA